MLAIIDLLERVAPRLDFYPGWAQALFTATFVAFVLAVVVFAALYPSRRGSGEAAER